jgi:2-polyprenyl-3-methyl-5-hydroxy-6-metoxy-1,4-benzoquinol methylase
LKTEKTRDKTIQDFGAQWTANQSNEGYYASQELFKDIVEPLIPVVDFAGKHCAEIGAGTGRISAMMLEADVASITAVEPSAAYDVLVKNLSQYEERVKPVQVRGDEIPKNDFDVVLSIGVVHHIPEPMPVMKAAYESLAPGGRMLIWLYGYEGNRLYLAIFKPLRAITSRLPVWANHLLAWILYLILAPYIALCRIVPFKLPLKDYLVGVLGRFSPRNIRLVIVDQLNPAWAKYYRKSEAKQLMQDAGFDNVELHHRHGYSWTVLGYKPD